MDPIAADALPSSTVPAGIFFVVTATVLRTRASESIVQADSFAKRRRFADALEENPDSVIPFQLSRRVCTGAPISGCEQKPKWQKIIRGAPRPKGSGFLPD